MEECIPYFSADKILTVAVEYYTHAKYDVCAGSSTIESHGGRGFKYREMY
nr:hypothetical protein [Escherichia coli]QUN01830.1 hypothetical protein [Escherichia coli]